MRMVMESELQLAPTHLSTIVPPRSGHSYVLYTHVTFCESLCPYCSFNRYVFQENRARKYFENLRSELRMVAEQGYTFQSMYIGGGTPTILVDELVKTIDLAKELFGVRDVSAETNPNHLIPEILEPLVGRVDRLSVVSKLDDGQLRQNAPV
jgi:coproporphyrinogen III oxidase-like Fe-S oxidoreductase